MTPQEDIFLHPAPEADDAALATEGAVILTLLPGMTRAHDMHDTRDRGDAPAAARPVSHPMSMEGQQRPYVLPALPQGAAQAQRRWHLSLVDEPPRDNAAHSNTHDHDFATQLHQSSSLPIHGVPVNTISLARRMMEQESPVTEQGPPIAATPGI